MSLKPGVVLLVSAVSASLFAQTDTLSLSSATVNAGGSTTLNLSLSSPLGNEPSAVQWTLTYSTSSIASLSVSTGNAAIAASKTITCLSGTGTSTCIISGLNNNIIQNGILATIRVTLSPIAVGTIPINLTGPVAASVNAAALAATATGGNVSVGGAVSISSVNCSPLSLASGASSVCTVTLNQSAPAGGIVVAVSSNNTSLVVPATVSVSSGSTSGTFTATTGSIATNQSATVTATYSGSSQQTNVSLVATNLTSLSCSPSSLGTGSTSTCTVTLSQGAGSTGVSVRVSSDNGLVTVPPSVTVASGSTTNTFIATAATISSNQPANVTASFNGTTKTATFSLLAGLVLRSLGCAQANVASAGASSCTITLSAAAPAGGITVTLSSNNPLLTVPASVVIASGSTTAVFTATAGTIGSSQTASVIATYNNSTQQTVLSLFAPGVVMSLVCSPLSLATGGTAICSVTLSSPPSSDAKIVLSSDNSLLAAPSSVTIGAGTTAASFTVNAGVISSNQTATLTAGYNNTSQSTSLSLLQAVLTSLTCPVSTLNSGGATNCSIAISTSAPAGGVVLTLTSSNSLLSVPATVTVPAGAVTASFTAKAGSVNANQTAVITASLNGVTQTASLALVPIQTLITPDNSNSLISGNYFVRHVSLGTDGAGHLTDPRSSIGMITFDGAGRYSFSGQIVQNTAASYQTVNGSYVVDAAGMVSLDSLLRTGDKVNARFGAEAIVGSTTESAGNAFDIFVAIPAPTSPFSNASLTGPYWAATLEFPAGSFAYTRSALFSLSSLGDGTFAAISNRGRAVNYASGQVVSEQISGATYVLSPDGSGTVNFGSASRVLSGTKTIYISRDGNILLGGTASSYDILIGIRGLDGSVTNTNWTGAFWGAGLRQDATAVKGFAGSAVASGAGSLYWTRRLKVLGSGTVDLTEVDPYSLAQDGSGTLGLAQVTLGFAGNLFLGSSVSNNDASAYEIYFGVRMPAASGSGLYVNPQGVQNVGSYAPTGNPIAPGELIYLYVSGLTVSPQSAVPPYPMSLGGVTVLINGKPAPLYLVSSTQLVVEVPFATTGPTASIVVQANGLTSNRVTVPVAATAPGIFSLQQNGSGFGAVRHADYSVVTADNPAHSGEIVSIYLTGLGAVNPPVNDGAGGGGNPLSLTTVAPTVLVGASPATVLFSGMSSYPGLYQINAQLPAMPPGVTTLPIVITTPNAIHDQVDIPIAP